MQVFVKGVKGEAEYMDYLQQVHQNPACPVGHPFLADPEGEI